jgi:hypothetical protein
LLCLEISRWCLIRVTRSSARPEDALRSRSVDAAGRGGGPVPSTAGGSSVAT